jgi:tetratricopeptide (TPR) repeat protein
LLAAALLGSGQAVPAQSSAPAATQAERKRLVEVFNAGLKAQAAKDWPTALSCFRQASAIDPKQHVVWAHLGETATVLARQTQDNGQRSQLLAEALAAYERAVNLKPDEASYRNNYAIALGESGDFPAAKTQLDAAIQADPGGAARYHYNFGAVAANSGHMPEACSEFRAALQADPNYSAAQQQLFKLCTNFPAAGSAPPSAAELQRYRQGGAANLQQIMKLIKDKLGSVGRVEYRSHDSKNGDETVTSWRDEVSNVRASAANCRVDFHFLQMRDGAEVFNADVSVLLASLKRVEPITFANIEPPLFGVDLVGAKSTVRFAFLDKAVADKMGSWLAYGANLCGANLDTH